jgi:hypothetical protein
MKISFSASLLSLKQVVMTPNIATFIPSTLVNSKQNLLPTKK